MADIRVTAVKCPEHGEFVPTRCAIQKNWTPERLDALALRRVKAYCGHCSLEGRPKTQVLLVTEPA